MSEFQHVQVVIHSRCVITGDDQDYFLLHSEEVKTKRSQVSELHSLFASVLDFFCFLSLKL